MTPKTYCRREKISGSEFGRRLGISKYTACRLIAGTQLASPKLALKIEKETKRAITRYDLRPDLYGRKPRRLRLVSPQVAAGATGVNPEQTAPAMQGKAA